MVLNRLNTFLNKKEIINKIQFDFQTKNKFTNYEIILNCIKYEPSYYCVFIKHGKKKLFTIMTYRG